MITHPITTKQVHLIYGFDMEMWVSARYLLVKNYTNTTNEKNAQDLNISLHSVLTVTNAHQKPSAHLFKILKCSYDMQVGSAWKLFSSSSLITKL